jgi:glycosyltransferase involved in cell wall biosynthesis
MKILIYTQPFAPSVGGAERYAMLLAQGLSILTGSDRVEVTLATPTPAGNFDDSQLGFPVVRQPILRRLILLIKKADVIQLVGPCFLPLLVAWLLRKPVVVEHHGYPPICPNGLLFHEPTKTVCPGHFMARRYGECLRCNANHRIGLNNFRQLLLTFPRRWLCKRVAANTPITIHVEKRLALPQSRVIYYGIPDPLTEDQSPSYRTPEALPLCFAYVGRLVTLKGLPLILDAAKHLQREGYNFRVKFIGDGPEQTALKDLTTRLDLAKYVEFTGFVIGPAFTAAMRDVAAVLMPSVWEETAGLAAIEQMMRGRLVIASDVGGLGEVVNGCGLRFPAGNTEALAQCMRTVLDHPEKITENGNMARRRAKNLFGERRMVQEHFELYCQIVPRVGRSKKVQNPA